MNRGKMIVVWTDQKGLTDYTEGKWFHCWKTDELLRNHGKKPVRVWLYENGWEMKNSTSNGYLIRKRVG